MKDKLIQKSKERNVTIGNTDYRIVSKSTLNTNDAVLKVMAKVIKRSMDRDEANLLLANIKEN